MQEGVERAQPASIAPGDIAALMDWWKLAGADVAVNSEAAPWLLENGPGTVTPPEVAEPAPMAALAAPSSTVTASDVTDWAAISSLEALRAQLLVQHPNAPFADGDPASGLMILGEAPSAEDLRSGRPFSGPAGLFLDRMLAAIGIDRTRAYISLLCPRRRVPGPPPPDAIAADLDLTRAHIRLAAPRVLLLLGANPVQALSGNSAPISRVRGKWLEIETGAGHVPALATFNPAFLLRRPEEKANAWADLLALRRRLVQ